MTQSWGFLTNHALVLVYVVRNSESTVRDISEGVGVTERAALAILRVLDDEGIVNRHKEGRRNTYSVNFEQLAAYRREGTASLTPREFIDGLIKTLLAISDYKGPSTNGHASEMIDSGALEPRMGQWGLFTNHALILLAIAFDSTSTVRELATSVGITERAVVAILNQLEDEGIIVRHREGRRNSYVIDFESLRTFPRWSLGDWRLPDPLIDMATNGLRELAARTGSQPHDDAG